MNNRCQAYFAGYEQGSSFSFMTLDGISAEYVASYAMGYVDAIEVRRFNKPKSELPEWMTEDQFSTVLVIYFRNEMVIPTFPEFLKKVEDYGDYCGLAWQGMFVGIEKDGYAHT